MRKGDWEILATLYECGNLTHAARTLFISQPALSKRLQNIEKEYHCKIAIRSNKGIVFTPQGEYLGQQGQQYLAMLREVHRHIELMNRSQSNSFKIAAPSSFTRYILPQLLKDFRALYPELEIKIQVAISSQIPELLAQGSIQAGFVNGEMGLPPNAIRFAVQPGYLLYHRPITLEELPGIPFISHSRSASSYNILQSWWNTNFELPQKIGMEVTDVETCLEMVRNGFGYTVIFLSMAKDLGDLYCLPLFNTDGTPLCRSTYFIHKNLTVEDTPLRAFVDFIKGTAIG